MPFVETPIMRLYDIGHMEEEDAWDGLADTNFARLEAGIHGFGTVTITGSDVTLDDTAFTGVAGIRKAHKIVGNQIANVGIIVPDKQRVFCFTNGATQVGGPWTVTIRTTAAATPNVVLSSGDTAIIGCDGLGQIGAFFLSSNYILKSGGTLTGGLNLNAAGRVSGAQDAESPQDYVTLKQVQDLITEAKRIPVGHILLTANVGNPVTWLGYGTWAPWAPGRLPLFSGTATDSRGETRSFPTVGAAGGEYAHQLVTGEMPSFTERGFMLNGAQAIGGSGPAGTPTNQVIGSDAPHNNLPPFMVTNAWLRTA